MSWRFRTEIRTWRTMIETDGMAHPEFHYENYDGRRLSLKGKTDISLVSSRLRLVETEITLHPSLSREATEARCRGFARLWPAEHGQSELMGVSIDLPATLWEHLWDRSSAPPPVGWVGFTLAEIEVERLADPELTSGKSFAVLSPYVTLDSK